MSLKDTFAKRTKGNVSTRVNHKAPSSSARCGQTSRVGLVAALCLGVVLTAATVLTAHAQSKGGSTEYSIVPAAVSEARFEYAHFQDNTLHVKYPKAWAMETKLSKAHSARALNGQIDITWSVSKLASGVELNKFSQAIVDRFVSLRSKKLFVERILSDTTETVNGTALRKVLIECTLEAKSGKTYKIEQMIVVGVSCGNGLILTCTAPAYQFNDFQPVFDDVINSISM